MSNNRKKMYSLPHRDGASKHDGTWTASGAAPDWWRWCMMGVFFVVSVDFSRATEPEVIITPMFRKILRHFKTTTTESYIFRVRRPSTRWNIYIYVYVLKVYSLFM